ncbi:M20 metallopeptidase family protein [Actinomadura scrupuli]|uniref:M20 metallopeptidase family protein n=1 Tax=Actinomadura scrupuli TaxID=559629 RepID=UPI003D983668
MAMTDDAADLRDDLVRLRRELHREPEIGLELPRTQERVLGALDGLPLEITTGERISSVTGVLRGGRPGPTVLLRGDMDALPVTERTGVPYASAVEGAMHACGHDLHTAMLVGAARLLATRRAELAGSVVFMFQPGEEGFRGAEHMIVEGVLEASGERPVAAYGLHVASSLLPNGWFAARPGPVLAAADQVRVTVRGVGGHGAQPHLAKDPVPAACEMVLALQTFVTRAFDVFDPVVLTVGSFHAGTKENVIPDSAEFGVTLRSFSEVSHARIKDGVVQVVRGIAAAHGLTVEIEFFMSYPVTINDAAETGFAEATIGSLFGPDRYVPLPNPLTASEDFSLVLNEVPGAFVFLGACPADRDVSTAPFNHAADAAFDDGVLPDGAALLAALAQRRLTADAERLVT